MGGSTGPNIVEDGLIFAYDMDALDTPNKVSKSWKGEPTTNLCPSPYSLGIYAYASGPVTTNSIPDWNNIPRSVYRYTVTNTVNQARARIIPNLVINTPYSFSFKVKYNGSTTASPSFIVSASKGSPEGNNNTITYNNTYQTDIGNGWYLVRYEFELSACPTGKAILTFGLSTGSNTAYLNETFDVYEPQFEQTRYASPYVNGTRSNTQALLDWTGNHTITANSLVYNSDNTFSFNGSNTYMYNSVPSQFLTAENTTDRTWEVWVKPASVQTNAGLFGHKVGAGCSYYCNGGIYINNTQYSANWYDNAAYQWLGSGVAPVANTWAHVVVTWNSTDLKFRIYVNGVLKATSSATNNNYSTGNVVYDIGFNSKSQFGGGGSSHHFNGDIGIAKYYYTKTLNDDEVAQNFNAMRRRYGV